MDGRVRRGDDSLALRGFQGWASIMIMFYYSVVTGWTLKYFVASVTTGSPDDPAAYWAEYSISVWQPIRYDHDRRHDHRRGFHIVAVLAGTTIVARGVVRGIERANKVLIPALFAAGTPGGGLGPRWCCC